MFKKIELTIAQITHQMTNLIIYIMNFNKSTLISDIYYNEFNTIPKYGRHNINLVFIGLIMYK